MIGWIQKKKSFSEVNKPLAHQKKIVWEVAVTRIRWRRRSSLIALVIHLKLLRGCLETISLNSFLLMAMSRATREGLREGTWSW